jgi:cell division GTPase FtsZ
VRAAALRLIVVLNEELMEVMGDDVTQDQAFAHANDVLQNAVGGISDIVHIPCAGEQSTSKTSRP